MFNFFKQKNNIELTADEIEKIEMPKVIKPEGHNINNYESKELDPFARSLDQKEVEDAKKKHGIDFYEKKSSEFFCSKIEESITNLIIKAENLIEEHPEKSEDLGSPEKISKETDIFKSINKILDEAKQLEKTYKTYIDAVSPELAKVYDIPWEIELAPKHGGFKQKIEYLLYDLENLKSKSRESKYALPSSFYTLTKKNEETGKNEYTVFTQDGEGRNELEANSSEPFNEWFYREYRTHKDFKQYFETLPAEQLKLIAKIMELYDDPELADRLVNFEDFIKTIKNKLDLVREIHTKYPDSFYPKRREFLRKIDEEVERLRRNIKIKHEMNIRKNIDLKNNQLDYYR